MPRILTLCGGCCQCVRLCVCAGVEWEVVIGELVNCLSNQDGTKAAIVVYGAPTQLCFN